MSSKKSISAQKIRNDGSSGWIIALIGCVTISVMNGIREAYGWTSEKKQRTARCDNGFMDCQYLEPQHLDLIEFDRGWYMHWGIYIIETDGQGWIIHLSDNGKVKREKLVEVSNGNRCRVNNLKRAAETRSLRRRSDAHILKYVYAKLNQELDYHVRENNCEHFVTECVYGYPFSKQGDAMCGCPIIQLSTKLYTSSNRTN